jgi:hypothetical protein
MLSELIYNLCVIYTFFGGGGRIALRRELWMGLTWPRPFVIGSATKAPWCLSVEPNSRDFSFLHFLKNVHINLENEIWEVNLSGKSAASYDRTDSAA